MLILVGVTINVALNGGLFEQAQEASKNTQIEADREQLLSAIVASYDIETGTIKSESELRKNLGDDWTVVEEGSVYKVTSPKKNIFTVDANGNIDYKGKNTPGGGGSPLAFSWNTVGLEVDTNTEYITANGSLVLSFSTDGKLSVSSNDINVITVDATDSKYISNGILDFTEEIMGKEIKVKVVMNSNNTDIDLIFVDSGVSTCIKDTEDIYTNEEVLQALGATGGEYKGIWTVIERDERGNPTKLVSTTAVTNCSLGDDDDLEKSISDYKNAESILNTAAQKATGIASARSINIEDIYDIIGEENVDKGTDYGKKYNYYYENDGVNLKYQTGIDSESGEIIWSDSTWVTSETHTFIDENGETVVVDSDGDAIPLTHTFYSYELTEEQQSLLGHLCDTTVWLASTSVECTKFRACFHVDHLNVEELKGFAPIFYSDAADGLSFTFGVVAVVSVSGL